MRKIDAFAHILPPRYARRLALGLPEADAAAIFADNARGLLRLPA